jgi:hypothetical protein
LPDRRTWHFNFIQVEFSYVGLVSCLSFAAGRVLLLLLLLLLLL